MAAATGAPFLSLASKPVIPCWGTSSGGKQKAKHLRNPTRRFAFSTDSAPTEEEKTRIRRTTRLAEEEEEQVTTGYQRRGGQRVEEKSSKEGLKQILPGTRKSLKDYLEESQNLVKESGGGGGPPRWFSPLECGSPKVDNPPLLLFLPGIDGVGLGLIRHHHSLGKIFDIWCLHIPVKDRTTFAGLVQLVEKTVRSENHSSPNRPIYLVGESLGACLALAVAARNPDMDLVLILANPATSFEKSQLQALMPLLEVFQDTLQLSAPYILSLMTGDDPLRMVMDNMVRGCPLQQVEVPTQCNPMPSYLSVLDTILPKETLMWKLQMIKSASAYTNSRIHAVRAQTLILSSERDQFLPSQEEGQRLWLALAKCEHRKFTDCGHFLLLEDRVDLVTTIKCINFYRRGRYHDYVSDYIPPTPSEYNKFIESQRWLLLATSPVMFSTLEDGKVVKGLAGVPAVGPVLFVGYHMLLACEKGPLLTQFFVDRNIFLRGMAHPMMFTRSKDSNSPELSAFDLLRLTGVVPVSGTNFYKLLASKAHVVLFPGGIREACHRKGEEYKLIWPEQAEFVRMAARFGAKIVPFGGVGEDDFCEVVFDYDDQMKVPFLREFNKKLTDTTPRARRADMDDEVGNQGMHIPGILPKFPGGRFYFYFGKAIETEGRKHEFRDKEKARELYLQVQSEVEKCLAFLREKRESDPYRNLLARLAYQATHGFDSEVPTFEL